jgi:hypothetical protein
MVIFNANNQAVFVLTALAGQTVSGSVFLNQGNYTIVFTAATGDGSELASVDYTLRAKELTDHLDPIPIGPGLPPPPPPPPPGEEGGGTTESPPPLTVGEPTTPDPSLLADPIIDPWAPPPPGLG